MDKHLVFRIVQIGTSPGILSRIIKERLRYSFVFTDCMEVQLQGLSKTILVVIDSPLQRRPIITVLDSNELHLKSYR